MKNKDLSKELDELNKTLAELNSILEKYQDEDEFEEEYDNEYNDDEYNDDEEFDDDLNGACGISVSFDIEKLLDPRYNEHILSEPDEDGMVEISEELYDSLFGKYHSKQDMLSDMINELNRYMSGKYFGYEGYWSKVYHLGIDKESNRPHIAQDEELEEKGEFDLYDITEFEKCYWTNANDKYRDTLEYKLVDDTAIRKLIDKYYPELEW